MSVKECIVELVSEMRSISQGQGMWTAESSSVDDEDNLIDRLMSLGWSVTSKGCTHPKLSVKPVSIEVAEELQNEVEES